MEIAAHHAEGQRVAAGMHMEKRLFLDRIALQRRHVAERHPQLSALIETHFADAAPAFADQTAMSAGEAADTVALGFPERASLRVAVQPAGERFVCDARFWWSGRRGDAHHVTAQTARGNGVVHALAGGPAG